MDDQAEAVARNTGAKTSQHTTQMNPKLNRLVVDTCVLHLLNIHVDAMMYNTALYLESERCCSGNWQLNITNTVSYFSFVVVRNINYYNILNQDLNVNKV